MRSAVPNKIAKQTVVKKIVHKHRRDRFIAAWLRAPLKVGAVMPSSRALAKAMAAQVDQALEGAVIELGPGTGVVTHALLKAGIASERLLVIERDRRMFEATAAQFPELAILNADAMELDKALAAQAISKVCAIVSSLPLLGMPKPVRGAIEKQMAEAIGDVGIIVQFTYGPKSPISGDELMKYRLRGKRVKTVLANIPPAHVWVYQRERRKVKR